ncbi:uncharacterized protein LOC121384524 [Gigantopelta aegis]|uniref:uncharacterized protein LOC121384524 n=1 Tax=Gigantopelta aegis TaxID=1735272 RepID=UPI001B88ACF0|nr:uncharacterized protein LOC121384524 [Gigantopelta aegis]
MCTVAPSCVLIVISLVCMIFGAMCIALTTWVQMDNLDIFYMFRISNDPADMDVLDTPSYVEFTGYLMAVCGIVMVTVAVIGFAGASCLKEGKSVYITYLVGMIVAFLLQLSAVLLVSKYNTLFVDHGEKFINAALAHKYVGPYNRSVKISTAWDATQALFGCCGMRGQVVFQTQTAWNRTWVDVDNNNKVVKATIPVTCCSLKPDIHDVMQMTTPEEFALQLRDNTCPVSRKQSNTEGCFVQMQVVFELFRKLFLAFSVFNLTVQASGILSGICILVKMNKRKDDEPLSNCKETNSFVITHDRDRSYFNEIV